MSAAGALTARRTVNVPVDRFVYNYDVAQAVCSQGITEAVRSVDSPGLRELLVMSCREMSDEAALSVLDRVVASLPNPLDGTFRRQVSQASSALAMHIPYCTSRKRWWGRASTDLERKLRSLGSASWVLFSARGDRATCGSLTYAAIAECADVFPGSWEHLSVRWDGRTLVASFDGETFASAVAVRA